MKGKKKESNKVMQGKAQMETGKKVPRGPSKTKSTKSTKPKSTREPRGPRPRVPRGPRPRVPSAKVVDTSVSALSKSRSKIAY